MSEGTKDKLTGRLKEAEGDLTGDDTRKLQGEVEEKKGELKDKLDSDSDGDD